MDNYSGIGKLLIILGGIIMLLGLLVLAFGKVPFPGKIPGDFSWKGKNWSIYFPLATSILFSIILSFIIWLIKKF